MKHLEIVKQATSKASEIDQLLSEITTAKEENMETVETKTQVLMVIIDTPGEYNILYDSMLCLNTKRSSE